MLASKFVRATPCLSRARLFSTANNRVNRVDNPYTGETFCEIELMNQNTLDHKVTLASKIQKDYYKNSTLDDRINLCKKFMEVLDNNKDSIAREISNQMGKPLAQSLGEISTTLVRTQAMIDLAPSELADEVLPAQEGLYRKLAKEPVGVVLCIAPWNYPFMTAINCIAPAILAGNSVILKHSSRTPLAADALERVFLEAGAPQGLLQAVHTTHADVDYMIAKQEIQHVQFTGSVSAGHTLYRSVASTRFIDVGLELGGKDPAYVAPDANIADAVEGLVDGGMYNAGQSCCGVERVYVHHTLYDDFLERAKGVVQQYVLGDPLQATTTMGPQAQKSAVPFLLQQIEEAKQKGANVLCGGTALQVNAKGRFFAPTLVSDCTHDMSIMTEETFGPILAVAPVRSDEEAIQLMNDSAYGLTASVFTQDVERATTIAQQLHTGTVFKNRCDYLDPYLAWTGVKDTGRGISLSRHGFRALTRVKSYNFKV